MKACKKGRRKPITAQVRKGSQQKKAQTPEKRPCSRFSTFTEQISGTGIDELRDGGSRKRLRADHMEASESKHKMLLNMKLEESEGPRREG